ncbi:hypothetical protein M514_25691 [Trichuris suis]|uniref:Uncharacterized protein n=1 Tax=Trichuris suis TaxID=68888 RepID=A0A085MXZ3_9BILA|nr:hypothetical protein M514_25691 [Trichuris suis]
MTGKSEEPCRRVFQELADFRKRDEVHLCRSVIITELELSAINAARTEFPGRSGRATNNSDNETSHSASIPAIRRNPGKELKPHLPEEAHEMTEWFEVNYVHEQIRRRLWNGVMVRPPPPFAPSLWSVFECMESGFPRTRNNIEAWHRRWKSLLGKVHVGVYQIVEEFRKAQRHVTKEDERLLRGEPCPQGKKEDIRHEERRQNVIRNREGRLNRMDYLRAIAQNSHM